MSRTASSAPSLFLLSFLLNCKWPLLDFLNAYQQVPRNVSSPQQLDDIEQQLAKASEQSLFCPQCKPLLKNLLRSESRAGRDSGVVGSLPEAVVSLCMQPKAFKNQGRRIGLCSSCPVAPQPLSIRVVLLQPQVRPRPTSHEHKGWLTPPWNALGIFDRLQSHLASHVALTVALSGSFDEARQGCCAYHKALL